MISAGAHQLILLADPKFPEELEALETEVALATEILSALDLSENPRITTLCENDPEKIEEVLWNLPNQKGLKKRGFQAIGSKREIGRIVFSNLREQSPSNRKKSYSHKTPLMAVSTSTRMHARFAWHAHRPARPMQ